MLVGVGKSYGVLVGVNKSCGVLVDVGELWSVSWCR